ncbi:MAG: DUF2842 domain-containing protein [Sphingomonadales bacterium]|nr:DUF2842 domain-containing protein [Sphingomonadales bacterium]
MVEKPVRKEPSWRIPAGVLLLVAALAVYAMAVARWLGPWISTLPVLAQLPVYVLLGVVWLWLLPVRRLLFWMEHGRLK